MANPDRAYGYEEEDKHPILTAILVFLMIVLPAIIMLGNVLGFWKVDLGPACPYYDSGGELIEDC